jgi:hypothetical protein
MGDLGAWLVRFGEIFDEIQNCGDAVTLSLDTAFSAPMEVSCPQRVLRRGNRDTWRLMILLRVSHCDRILSSER